MTRDITRCAVAVATIAVVTFAYASWLHVTNATTVALTFLLVVLVVAATSRLWIAVTTSVVAMACINFFFLPPVGNLTIADPQNWVALFAFLAVSLIASNLSSAARGRAREALERRDEMARLFDLSRDVLLMTDTREAIALLARFIARRFDLDYVAICLPDGADWEIAASGSLHIELDRNQLRLTIAAAERTLEFDARERTYSGHRTMTIDSREVRIVPLRLGTKPIGILAAAGRPVDPGSLDVLGGIVAIAIERVQFLEERKSAEIARKSEELKSALLASLGHDLRTPLTAIRVAAGNLQASWLGEAERREQSQLVLAEVERLTRLFQNILDMARIDAGAVATELQWVHPAQIVDAARDQVEHTLGAHPVEVALRAVADEVGQKAASYRVREGSEPALIPERVMVCMSSNVHAPRVIRTGARIAGRLGAKWYAVYVATPQEAPGRINPGDSEALRQNVALAENLGATFVQVKAGKPADGLIAFAQREGITHVIFGQSARSRWELLWRGSTIDRFLGAVRDAAVQVVPFDEA